MEEKQENSRENTNFLQDMYKVRWRTYRSELKRCQAEPTEEAVHDLRVATRRLLALIDLLRDIAPNPRLQKLRQTLKKQFDSLNDLRDTQVMLVETLESLDELLELEPFQKYLNKRERRLLRSTAKSIKAFKYSAVDYLLKPIDPDELKAAFERAENKIYAGSIAVKQIEVLMQNLKASRPFLLSVPTSEGLEFININDIINIRAEGSYSVISLVNKLKKMISKNIGEFQEHLPYNEFCRVQNSYIINLKYVKKMTRKGGLTAEMAEGTVIPISRNKKEAFMQKIEKYLYNKNS